MRKVEVSIKINATPKEVISAFTEPERLKDWWAVERTLISKKSGGIYTLAWQITDRGVGFISTGTIRDFDPNKKLVVENLVYINSEKPFLGPMTLTITAKQRSAFAEVYLCQDGYQEGDTWNWYYQAVNEAWPKTLETLKGYLEK